jgi:hypothetical protein
MVKRMSDQEKQSYITKLMKIMTGHVGKSNRIGMGELYEQVFGESYQHRINDTRRIRKLIEELRQDGVGICSIVSKEGGGYFISSGGSEMNDYCKKLRSRALKLLAKEAKLRKMTMPELVGQVQLALEKEA